MADTILTAPIHTVLAQATVALMRTEMGLGTAALLSPAADVNTALGAADKAALNTAVTGGQALAPLSVTTSLVTGNHADGLAISVAAGKRIRLFSTTPSTGGEYLDIIPDNATAQAENRYGVRSLLQISNANTAHAYGSGAILGEIYIPTDNSQAYSGRQTGVYGNCHHAGSGLLSDARGLYGIAGIYGTGSFTNACGIWLEVSTNIGSTGNITNAIGCYITSVDDSGSGSITNAYGLKVDVQTAGATLNFNIYSQGGKSRIDNILVGTDSGTNGVIQLLAATSSTSGIAWGAGNERIYRSAANTLKTDAAFVFNAATTFAEDIGASATASFDIGKTGTRFRNGWFSGTLACGGTITTAGVICTGSGEFVNYIRVAPLTYAGLTAAGSAGNGARAYITDATLAFNGTNIGSAAAGGGANHSPVVVVDGAWVIG